MATGSLSVEGSVTGLLTGTKTVGPVTVSTTAAVPNTSTVVALASGANTVSVPTTASAVLIVFAAASTVSKTIKGVTGDTGIQVKPNGPVLLSFDSAAVPSSIVITAGAADTGNTTEVLFI